MIKTMLQTVGVSTLIMAAYLLGFMLTTTMQASAQAAPTANQAADKPQNTPPATYTYLAQPNDTYTQMARKAIQTYGITDKVNLSPAEIICAETNLTQEAGSPLLKRDASVTIEKSTVKKWIEAAQKISDAKEARWAKYAAGANFNTDHVGQH